MAYCQHHRHPKLDKPITRVALARELRELYRGAGLAAPIKIKFTKDLKRTHEQNTRRYAQVHPYSRPVLFEFAPQVVYLPPEHRKALLAHEVGHVLAPEEDEDGADAAAEGRLGVKIGYDHRWPGKGLQVAMNVEQNGPREEVFALLKKVGAEPLRRGAKHPKFRLPNGMLHVLPGSPSDFRSWQNNLSELKRKLRGISGHGRVQPNPNAHEMFAEFRGPEKQARYTINREKTAHELFAEFRGPEKQARYTINPRLRVTDYHRRWRIDTKINVVVLMDGNDFLRLAEPLGKLDQLLHEAYDLETYNRLTASSPPVYLEIELADDGVNGRVVGHEGRHRVISQLRAHEPIVEVSLRLLQDHRPDRGFDVYDLPVYWHPQDQESPFIFSAKNLIAVSETNVQERYQRAPRISNREMDRSELSRMLNAKLLDAR